ncbi:MAG: WYL domain-containing protein [Lachnospiraceae bacterium]|nr:WYL domain-containing protein [Lachnospiraceae bacterium]
MPRSENQKLKLLYLLQFLQERSDPDHPVSTNDVIAYLASKDISVERKTVYADIQSLQDFGFDILHERGRDGGYYLAERDFELAELKLLVDAVQASRFITAKKTKELIGKLTKLASSHEAGQLKRQVYVDRIKNENESIYYSVDEIHHALQENKQIAFYYFEWGTDKVMHPRRDGKRYQVSPYYLIWKDELYYLVAYDAESSMTKYYRVDKMKDLTLVPEMRLGQEVTGKENPAMIAGRVFSMFSGKEETVHLEFPKEMIGVVIDRFGKGISVRPTEEDGIYKTHVTVDVSPQFYGWLSGLSGKVRLTGPNEIVKAYLEYLQGLLGLYQQD